MPTTPHSAQDRRCQAAIPHSGCDRSPVRQLQALLRHPGRCGSTVGTCDAVQDVLGTALATVLPTPCTSFVLSPPQEPSSGMGTTLGSGSDFDQDKTLACRTLGTSSRHAWSMVPPTATTTPPAGATRMPARSPQGQGRLKCPLIREDLKVIQYQSQEADKTFITSDGTSPYNSTRKWAV